MKLKFRELLTTVRGLRVGYQSATRGSGTVISVDLKKDECMVKVDAGCSFFVKTKDYSAEFISDGFSCINMKIDSLYKVI